MYILVDIDHTLSNAFWRDSMIGIETWDYYHDNSKWDKPFKHVANLINSLSSVGYKIIAVTGRTEKHRAITTKWLIDHKIDVDEILMRPDDTFLSNAEMKLELVKKWFHSDYKNIHFLIDDNEKTILAFMELGITTLQIRNINGGTP